MVWLYKETGGLVYTKYIFYKSEFLRIEKVPSLVNTMLQLLKICYKKANSNPFK